MTWHDATADHNYSELFVAYGDTTPDVEARSPKGAVVARAWSTRKDRSSLEQSRSSRQAPSVGNSRGRRRTEQFGVEVLDQALRHAASWRSQIALPAHHRRRPI